MVLSEYFIAVLISSGQTKPTQSQRNVQEKRADFDFFTSLSKQGNSNQQCYMNLHLKKILSSTQNSCYQNRGWSGAGSDVRLKHVQETRTGTSMMVQWLRFCTPNAGGPYSIPGQGSQIPKTPNAAVKILAATTKTRCSQINNYYFLKRKRNKNSTNMAHGSTILEQNPTQPQL